MQDAARYLCVKDGGAARKAAMLSTILFLVGPVIWFIPPMAARILYPDLTAMFPSLKNPAEGAYVAIAMKTMPAGLLGLLVTGIFSATMSSMDTGLNRNAGVFIKNVYQPLMRPHASEKELLMVGKIITAFFGIIVILTALVYSTWENVGLFKLMINFSALVSMPYSIPLFWCLIIRRTPPWSAWSTVLVCLVVSLLVSAGPGWEWVQGLAASTGLTPVVDWAREHDFVASMAANIIIGSAWFLGSCLFYNNSPAEYKKRSGEFFAQMHRPWISPRKSGREPTAVKPAPSPNFAWPTARSSPCLCSFPIRSRDASAFFSAAARCYSSVGCSVVLPSARTARPNNPLAHV